MWKRYFSRQARKPSGLFGRVVARRIFDRGNDGLNSLMLDAMAPQPGQAILEIGFGCGNVIRQAADRVANGRVEGIDFSKAMLGIARKRNRKHIKEGRVSLQHGDFDQTVYKPGSFDTVCSSNTIYFWPDRLQTCKRIHSVLKPDGRIVLAFVDKTKMKTMPLDMDVFQAIASDEVEELLVRAGFSDIKTRFVPQVAAQRCVTGRK